MKVRVFNHPEGVKVLVPTYPEALDKDTKRFFQEVEYFDCDSSDIPPKKLPTGDCQRCHWKFDGVNKKVVVNKTKDCEHDILKNIHTKINNTDKQVALDGLLELEKFKLRKGK